MQSPLKNADRMRLRVALSPPVVVHRRFPGSAALRTVDIGRVGAGPGGGLLIAWREQDRGDQTDVGGIWTRRSSDDGRSWSEPVAVVQPDSTSAYGNVVLHAHDEMLHAYVGRVPAQAADSELQVLVRYESGDEGRSWHEAEMQVAYPEPTIHGGPLLRAGDDWLLPFHRNDTERVHGVLASPDLVHWDLRGLVPDPQELFLQEGFLTAYDEQVQLWMRAAYGGKVQRSTSRDGGRSWSTPEPDEELPNHDTKGAVRAADGYRVALYNEDPDRTRLYVRAARTDGPWGPPTLVSDHGGWNTYAMATEPISGAANIVWERGRTEVLHCRVTLRST